MKFVRFENKRKESILNSVGVLSIQSQQKSKSVTTQLELEGQAPPTDDKYFHLRNDLCPFQLRFKQ